jgi:hypothetical protein
MKDTKSTVEISKPLSHPELDSKCLLTILVLIYSEIENL